MILGVFLKILRKPFLLIRSAVIGTIVGIIPGAGGNIASMVSYNEAVRASRYPHKFGKGYMYGVAAAETANNAEVSDPSADAGHTRSPSRGGPARGIAAAGNAAGSGSFHDSRKNHLYLHPVAGTGQPADSADRDVGRQVGVPLITRVPVTVLAPFIFLLSVIGSYAINKNMFDVFVMLFFGLLGYVGRKIGFSPGPVVLGLILGDICEQGLVQSILMGRASGSILQMFFTRPISIVLIVLTLMSALFPVAQGMVRRRGSREKR